MNNINNDLISRQQAIDAVKKNTFRLKFVEEQNYESSLAWSAKAVYSELMEEALLDLPSIQPTSSDCISRQAALNLFPDDNLYWDTNEGYFAPHYARTLLKNLPSIQPERKDAIEKAVAVEAISDELMSRFDISATYAYEVAEAAVNRIEVMAKELERGDGE